MITIVANKKETVMHIEEVEVDAINLLMIIAEQCIRTIDENVDEDNLKTTKKEMIAGLCYRLLEDLAESGIIDKGGHKKEEGEKHEN